MTPVSSDRRYHLGAVALVAGAAMLRVVYLACGCSLDLAADEAHYWDWSRRLDWCYYSKGPLVAWLIRLSCACLGDTMLAVRLPAVACGSLLLVGLHALTMQIHGSARLAFLVVALAQTLPVVAVGSVLMTIDAPFTCAWMGALVFAHRAAVAQGGWWNWPAAGVCVLLGVLAKHTMVLFVPSFLLFLVTTPSLRGQLRQTGCWVMAGLGALGGVPILVWNARHGWVTFTHTLEHAGFEEEVAFFPLGPLRYLAAQFALLLGFWFIAWLRALWKHRPTVELDPGLRLLWWMSVPTFVFFLIFSCKNGGGGANWPTAGYLSGIVLVAGLLDQDRRDLRTWHRRTAQAGLALASCLGVLLIVFMHFPGEIRPVLLSIAPPPASSETSEVQGRRLDPTTRLRGWRHLAAEVDALGDELASRGIEPVLASERWSQTGPLAFYGRGQPRVHTLGMLFNDRPSQCDLWRPNPVFDAEKFEGQSFIVVNMTAEQLVDLFESVEPTRRVEHREAGRLIASWPVAIGHGYRLTASRRPPPPAPAAASASTREP